MTNSTKTDTKAIADKKTSKGTAETKKQINQGLPGGKYILNNGQLVSDKESK